MGDRAKGPQKVSRKSRLIAKLTLLSALSPLGRRHACSNREEERTDAGGRMALEGSLKGAIAESVTRSPSKAPPPPTLRRHQAAQKKAGFEMVGSADDV